MSSTPSSMARALVLRELQDGMRDDALWLQALSECQLDPVKTKLLYTELRVKAVQADMKNLLVTQIREAIRQDQPAKRADFLSLKDMLKTKK